MSNNKFQEYTTSTAFNLSLSKRMIQCLLLIKEAAGKTGTQVPDYLPLYEMNTLTFNSLKNRGLIEWREVPAKYPYIGEGKVKNGPYLTKAGKYICLLLSEAGFECEAMVHAKAANS